MKTISGDLIHLAKSGDFDLIVHGCNCFCTMGPGIAKAIKAVFPAACDADLATAKGDRSKLGTCTFAVIDQNGAPLVLVNAYTQFDTGAVVRRWTTMPSAPVSDGSTSSIPGRESNSRRSLPVLLAEIG